jgi:hypothetical protein
VFSATGTGTAHPRAFNFPKSWMQRFGTLADLKQESNRITQLIQEGFEQIDPEDRQ